MVDINAPFMLIRKRLDQLEGSPPNTRYNPDTDTVETTPDGGTTWNEDEAADPRSNPAFQLPAPIDPDRCAAAGGMIIEMKKWITAAAIGATIGGTATAILAGLVFLIPGVGWLWALALAVSGSIFATGGVTIGAAFTTEVWDELLCIIYDQIDGDGMVDAAALDAIQAEVDSEIGGAVSIGVALIFQTWGFVGLSNAGVVSADPEADCTCGWRAEFPVATAAGIWALYGGGAGGDYVSGFHTTTVFVGGDPNRPRRQVYIQTSFASSEITHIDFLTIGTTGTTAAGFVGKGIWSNNFATNLGMDFTLGVGQYNWDGLMTLDDLQINFGSGASESGGTDLGDGTITLIAIEGLQPPPTEFLPYLV